MAIDVKIARISFASDRINCVLPDAIQFNSVIIEIAKFLVLLSNFLPNSLLSIGELETLYGLSVYPNPNTGDFTIEMNIEHADNLTIKIYNPLGHIIFIKELRKFKGSYEEKVDMSQYPVGIYNLRLFSDKGVITKKIIIE